MIDILFYQKALELKRKLLQGEQPKRESIADAIEACRSESPVVYNIETTSNCNMRCVMCPRTKLMNRKIQTMSDATFEKVASQIVPWTSKEWSNWQDFCETEYQVGRCTVSENNFFLHVIPRVVVLHGYGDPLLDNKIVKRVKLLSDRNIPSYFSCNPGNIQLNRVAETCRSGLGYIKFSVDSTNDAVQEKMRGRPADFEKDKAKIKFLLALKQKEGWNTVFVVTMIDFGREETEADFDRLRRHFSGDDVYVYLKSQDQRWLRDSSGTEAIHWLEFCQYPWSSMSVQADGRVVACETDYNAELTMGDVHKNSLHQIWNSTAYRTLRLSHVFGLGFTRCRDRCDRKKVGELCL